MKLELTNRAKVLAGVVVLIGAAAAAWFLYGEEWLAGPPAPPPMAVKPKPAAAPVTKAPEAPKPVPEAPKPVAEAPKPAPEAPKPVADAPKPAAPAIVPVAQAPAAPKDETVKPKRVAKKKDSTQAKALAREAAAQPVAAKEPAQAKASASDMPPIPAPIPVQAVAAPAETAVKPAAPVQMAAAAPARAARAAPTSSVGPLRFNDLVTAVLYRDPEAVNALLAFGKWPDKSDSRGLTPLMYAAMMGDARIAESLLQAGANPNMPGPGGDTALSIARERKDAGMQALLQRHGGR